MDFHVSPGFHALSLVDLLCHERDVYGLPVKVCCIRRCFSDISAVHEPEPGRHGGGELNEGVIDKGEGGRAGHVLPLGTGRST